MRSSQVLTIMLGFLLLVGCSCPTSTSSNAPTRTPLSSPVELLSPLPTAAPTFTPHPTEIVSVEAPLQILVQDTRDLASIIFHHLQENHITHTGLVGVYIVDRQYAAAIVVPDVGANPIYVFLQNSEKNWQVIDAASPYPDRVIGRLNLPEEFAGTSSTYHIINQGIAYVQETGITTGYLHIEGVDGYFVRVCVTPEDQEECSLTLFLKAQESSFENYEVLIGEALPNEETMDQYEIPASLRKIP